MSVVFYYKPQQIEVLIETAAQYSLQCLQLLSLLQRCTASSRMWFTLSRIACVWCCILSSLCAQEPAESQLESSHAQLAAEGDGEEVTGRSSSSTFRRFQLVCGKSITHFQELLDHPQLTDVYSTIKREFVASDGLDHLFHKKIVPSKNAWSVLLISSDNTGIWHHKHDNVHEHDNVHADVGNSWEQMFWAQGTSFKICLHAPHDTKIGGPICIF